MKLANPPGNSVWSVERVPVQECAPEAPVCPGAWKSKFYDGWVKRESAATAEARYAREARALALELEGSRNLVWEAGRVLGALVNESGNREDVVMGRVSTKDEQKAGLRGAGLGPSGEVCVMQILPSMAQKFGGPKALLGDSEEALRLCFRAGLEQLRRGDTWCGKQKRLVQTPSGPKDVGRLWASFALYGTGNSCTSQNDGKTEKRANTARWMMEVINANYTKPERLSSNSP